MDSEGARLLTYSTVMPTVIPACRLCINIHHYAPPRTVLQSAMGQRSITYKGSQLWCSLPEYLKYITSTLLFKLKLKKYLHIV